MNWVSSVIGLAFVLECGVFCMFSFDRVPLLTIITIKSTTTTTTTEQWLSSISSRKQVFRPLFLKNQPIWMTFGSYLLLHGIHYFYLTFSVFGFLLVWL